MQNNSSNFEKKIALVLGCHRSGTSLVTAGLEDLGFYLGIEKQIASNENPKGFFENEEIVKFNNRFLSFLDGTWDNPLFDGSKSISSKSGSDLHPWMEEAIHIMQSEFEGHSNIGIKDPRMCQLLHFWKRVLDHCGYSKNNIFFIHVARHPIEVALSQYKRKQENPDFYFLGEEIIEMIPLWTSMSYQALRDSGSENNILLNYTQVLDKPKTQLLRLAKFLRVEFVESEVDKFCDEFVDKKLHRNIAGSKENNLLKNSFPEALQIFNLQKSLATKTSISSDVVKKVQEICLSQEYIQRRNQFMTPMISKLISERLVLRTELASKASERDIERVKSQSLLEQVTNDKNELITRLEAEITNLEDHKSNIVGLDAFNKRLAGQISDLTGKLNTIQNVEKEYLAIKDTISWKITGPLRRIRRLQINITHFVLGNTWPKIRISAKRIHLYLNTHVPLLSWMIAIIIRPFYVLLDKASIDHSVSVFESRYADTLPVSITGFYSSYQQRGRSEHLTPLVTIIVPNYNHAPYLGKRLDSIYEQTYQNFEVIILDDCSSDYSRNIIEDYSVRYPDITRTFFNDKNSGGVFYQWNKGLAEASGDLVWIAESDDWCATDFLERLVGYFNDEAVMLAYGRTAFMDEAGDTQIWTIEEYLSDIDVHLWQKPFVETAHRIVNRAWAIKNIVPNVSSAIFRNPKSLEILENTEWKQMRICGDWVFYLHIIRGGLVAYAPTATNYHRIHSNNISVSTYSKDSYYAEHEIVAKWINRLYEVPEYVFEIQGENIKQHWKQFRPDFNNDDFKKCYDIDRIRAVSIERKPNLLMACYAFAAGGGETFAIQLANLLKNNGYGVTFLNFDQETEVDGIRNMLRRDIPVINNFPLLAKLVTDLNIEIVHSHHGWVDGSILDLLPEDYACHTVICLHGFYETMEDKDLMKVLPRILSRTDKLAYTADKNLEPFKKDGNFDEELFVKIDNALEIPLITPVDLSSLGIEKDAFVLCLVSRALPEKGWAEAIESVQLARNQSNCDIHLVIIGEGKMYDKYKKIGHPEFVHLLGFREDFQDYYAVADMGFLPSRFKGESYPLTVIDCLNTGTPVLASDVGEMKNMLSINGKLAGCLFSLENWSIPVQKVADIISRCATDKKYYSQIKQLAPLAAAKFDPDFMCAKYADIYTELFQTKH